MKYLKLFQTTAQYNAYTADTANFITPNVSVCEDAPTVVHYNPLAIPIPVEGDFQVFADPECTKYATGEVDKVYVRVNRPWGFDEGWGMGSSESDSINAISPEVRYPEDPYFIMLWVDFVSQEQSTPYTAGEVVECTSGDLGPIDVTNFDKVFTYVPEFVDLGLPSGTKWADCNLGASNEYLYGKYFSWGNVDGVTSVDTEGIAAMTESAYAQTKGATLTGDIPATAEYDAAIARFQGIVNCQIPTKAQFQELYDNCDWIWQDDYNGTGIKGYEVTSNFNGKAIFLPAAGYVDDGSLDFANTEGLYWSSSYNVESDAYCFTFGGGSSAVLDTFNCFYGGTIRPVQS